MINFTSENSFVLAAIDETMPEGNATAGRNGEDFSVVITDIYRNFFSDFSVVKEF
jgi:hypothetical protein